MIKNLILGLFIAILFVSFSYLKLKSKEYHILIEKENSKINYIKYTKDEINSLKKSKEEYETLLKEKETLDNNVSSLYNEINTSNSNIDYYNLKIKEYKK